ncbi:MAG TPA: enoyl-CoA hydratase/isomerase family protein [Bacteroidia bacterium]|jgi:methylglutaconyl-CoA hydratase|nr:enoyl-CoA hydratase/isomerase family protein [Bacteroidia bacterium]
MTAVNIFQQEIIIPPLLNPRSIGDLSQQITKAENENVSFLILKGSNSVFCEGLDLKWVTNNQNQDHYKDMQEYASCLKKLQTGKCISIAVVSGSVSGGGMGIVCASDHVIATESSLFSLPEGLLGLIPGMILPALLNKLSPDKIKKMVLTGLKYSAANALEFGIADEIVKNDETHKAIENAIKSMRSCKRDTVGDIKTMLYNSSYSKDELSEKGMQLLLTKLNNTEIKERLTNLSEFL